jgi:hypothetical protein
MKFFQEFVSSINEASQFDADHHKKIAIGDIFYSSWGYDQTNVDFYKVVSKTAKKVIVREVKSERVGGDKTIPTDEFYKEDTYQCVVNKDLIVCRELRSGGWLYPYNGNPKYTTPFGSGH